MANASLTIGGDPGGALAAIAAVQGALGGLTGKTVIVDVQTRGGGDASRALDDIGKSADGAAAAHDRQGSAARRATDAIFSHAEANNRASDSARSSAAAHSRAADDVASHGRAHEEASRNVDSMSDSMRAAQGEAGRTTKTFDDMWKSTNKGAGPDFLSEDWAGWGGGVQKAAKEATSAVEEAGESGEHMAERLGSGVKTASSLGSAMGALSSAAGPTGQALMVLGIAGGVSALAMGALGAATAGVGVGAAIGDIMKSEPMMNQARKGVEGFTEAFHKMSSQTADAGLPGMKSLSTAAGTLGTTLAKVGVEHMAEGLGAATVLTAEATGAIKQLDPVIKPAINAVTALGGAALGALGNSAPAIGQFANVVSQAAPGLQSFAEGGIQAMGTLGGEFVKVVAAAAPLMHVIANVAGGATDLVNGVTGMDSSFSSKPAADGSTPEQSTLNKVGAFLKPAAIAAFIPGPVGIAASAAVSHFSGGGEPNYPMVSTQGGQAMPLYPATANSLLGQDAKPGQATFTGGGRFAGTGEAPAGAPTGTSVTPFMKELESRGQYKPEASADDGTALNQPKPADQASKGQLPGLGGSDKPLKAPQVGGGTSLGTETQQTRALTAAMNDATRATGQLGSSSTQTSRAVSAGMQGAGQSAAQLPQHVGQAASQMPAAVAQHAAQIPAAMAQPMAQVPKAAAAAIQPAAIAAPVHQAVQHVASAAPAASDAGSDVGSSVGEGMGKGMTKTITNTLTIVENWVTKIIKTAASVLDSHSPSRVFEGLGMSVGQGMELGVQKSTDLAVSATGSMMSGVVDAGAGALSSSGGGVSPSALSVGSLASGSAGNSSLASGGGLGGQLSSIIGGDGGSLSAASAQLNDHFGQLGQLGQSVAPTLQSTLLGPNGALGTLNKYNDGLQKAAGPQSAALRLMSDGNSQITGNPYSSGGGGKPQTDAEKQAQAEWTANRKDQLTKANRGFSDNTLNNIANNQWAHEQRREAILGRRDENHNSALYQAQHPGVSLLDAHAEYEEAKKRQEAAPKGPDGRPPALQMRSPSQVASDNLAQQAQQRQQQQAQQQKTLREASDPRTAALTGIGGSFGPPPQISDLQRNKGQAAAGADGRAVGQSYGDGLTGGLKDSKGKAQTSAGEVADALNDKVKKVAGINSPSTVWAGYGGDLVAGLTGGMGGALTGASSGISGIADNTGLQVGFLWARGVQDGIQRQFKSADFQSDAVPQLSSQQALTALGIGGQLGASGGGGLVNKNPSVTINASGSGSQQPIQLAVMLDGQPFYDYVTTAVNSAFDQYADSQLRN